MIDPRRPNFALTPVSAQRPAFACEPRPADPADDYSLAPSPPAVAVVTPYFNTGEVFHQTAATVLGQSLQNFEWIIVNDCSTDAAAIAVLNEYRPGGARNLRRDPRIRIVDHRVNHGLSATRDTGFRTARAPYVFQLDADDLIEPTTLEKCALFLETNPAFAFVKGNTVGFGGQEYLWEKGFHDRERFLDQNLVTATAMLRREVHTDIGGFDDRNRGGMEDWEFWLRAASRGLWGGTIPEFLDWYRRRPPEVFDSWANLKCEQRNAAFKDRMRREHAPLFTGAFPDPQREWHMPYHALWNGPRFSNPLDKPANCKRLLLVVPWLRMGGADRFNLDLVRFLRSQAWDVTIVCTLSSGTSPATGNGHPWLPEFARFTPDIFILPHLGSPPQYPALVRYLIDSRLPDIVLISNSEHGYAMLPYLRAERPGRIYLDFNHMEEPHWKNGGHPRHGAGNQAQLDLNITVSHHLKRWMTAPPRNAYADRIEVCHINADSRRWKPDLRKRAAFRRAHRIADDAVVILYAARFCAQKQPHILVDSLRLLRDQLADRSRRATPPRPPIAVLIAGEGELEPELRRSLEHANLLGVGDDRSDFSVHLLGPVKTDRMPSVMAAADIFFLPSEWEGIALSIYEAMAAGLAVVGADVGGQSELVTPDSGLLLPRPPGDPALEAAQYAFALAALIEDPDRRAALSAAARSRIENHFELSNMGARMLALFDLAAEHHRIRPRQRLDPHFAIELTSAAIESLRAQDLCDQLWQYRMRCDRIDRAAHQPSASREAARAIAYIESSASWRLIQSLKKLPPYTAFARARYGRDWRDRLVTATPRDPLAQLDHMRSSRAYRALLAVKKSPPARVITRLRHGADHREHIPESLRND